MRHSVAEQHFEHRHSIRGVGDKSPFSTRATSMPHTYFVYENWRRNRGRIHLAQCSMCKEGRGTKATDSGRNGKWHGPFYDRDQAFKAATRLNRADMQSCGIC